MNLSRCSLALLWLLFFAPFFAQAQDNTFVVPEITVQGETETSAYLEALPNVNHLSGQRFERKKQATVGETLSREAGVSSTFFGPNASRPIIRGQDGDRIRLMENGTGTLDASSASPDHAVSVDPLVVDSVDIIHGPSALLYGNTAMGGVVNVKTKRIASQVLQADEYNLNGSLSSVDRGRSLGLLGRQQLGKWVLEYDASGRGTEDYAVPGFVRSKYEQARAPLAPGELEETARVQNSSNRSYQAGLGLTHFGDQDHAGVAISALQSNYGTVAEKSVIIDLQRFRLDAEYEKKINSSFIQSAKIKGAGTAYRHQEIDAGSIGTTFRNRGGELRADLKHAKVGAMEGVFGAQVQAFQFSALGDEAFLPTTFNHSYALFAYESWKFGNWVAQAGARADASGVSADPFQANDAGSQPSNAESRNFFTPSASAGLTYHFSSASELGLNLTYTERAPNYQELFADGAHLATGVYERGNRELGAERSVGAELYVRQKDEQNDFKASVYAQSFSSFIALSPTGANYADPATGELFPRDQFNSVSALLAGFEAQWTYAVPLKLWDGHLETELKTDFVRGIDRSNQSQLPRTPPLREGLTLTYRKKGVSAFAEWQRSEAQGLLAVNELRTDAFDLIHVGIEAPLSSSFGDYRLSFRVNNLLNEDARIHTSFLKDIAPLPGRNFVFGLQASL